MRQALRRAPNARLLRTSLMCVAVAVAATGAAQMLQWLIRAFTNLSFYGRLSSLPATPVGNHLGLGVIAVPVVGALVVGVMARWGSPAIRGHGIPEVMERVLRHESRIPARVGILKPLSAAISIGTGGPFGAEGPIIATGSALGSLLGQLLPSTARERKTLLAAGAAAGMTATFGSPVSAVLLALELLLFEMSPATLAPVAFAAGTAAALRAAIQGEAPVFPVPTIPTQSLHAVLGYVVVGAVVGAAAVGITRLLFTIEGRFERLAIHWMWWPALGGVVVGVVGWIDPRTLGIGMGNIDGILRGDIVGGSLVALAVLKFVSWSIALGSGTSGGTLAPLFTVGGGVGALLGASLAHAVPWLGVDPRVAALVGMAAMFAGASRALLASVVFAFETTRQPGAVLPLLLGCAAAYVVASKLLRESIMTLKIERRGVGVPLVLLPAELDQAQMSERAPGLLKWRGFRAWPGA